MSQHLQGISQIAFESGATLTVEQLPPHIKQEVLQYNAWTAQAERIQHELETLEKQFTMLSYARTASFNTIQQLANELEKTVETHTPVIDPATNPVAEEDGA